MLSERLDTLPEELVLSSTYDWDCPICDFAGWTKPSLFMELGRINLGTAVCPRCKFRLSLKISKDNTRMEALIHECHTTEAGFN